jgi:hypothetical protein
MLALLPLLLLAQPAVETVVPPGAIDAGKWYTAESTVSADTSRVHTPGAAAIHWHVPIDHTAGEPKYPVGWPRTGLNANPHWDWSSNDYLEFWLYAATSREALPAVPLGLGVNMPDKTRQFNLTVPAVKDQWVQVRVPVADLPNPADVAQIQFHVAEANYRHGDTVDFWIADLALARYTQPTVLAFQPRERLLDARATYVPVDIHLTGIAPGATQPAQVVVRRDGQDLAVTPASLTRGRLRLVLPLPTGLTPGPAELVVRLGEVEAAKAPVTLIAGPFAE